MQIHSTLAKFPKIKNVPTVVVTNKNMHDVSLWPLGVVMVTQVFSQHATNVLSLQHPSEKLVCGLRKSDTNHNQNMLFF